MYHWRWGHETYYLMLKGRMELENFSGRTVEAVRQDLQAAVLLANLESVLSEPAQVSVSAVFDGSVYRINEGRGFDRQRGIGKGVPVIPRTPPPPWPSLSRTKAITRAEMPSDAVLDWKTTFGTGRIELGLRRAIKDVFVFGFIALELLRQSVRVDIERSTRLCRMQAPAGARVASPQSPILRRSKSGFPVSVSLGVSRAGNGKRPLKLIPFEIAADFTALR